jgi:hypothetical protein
LDSTGYPGLAVAAIQRASSLRNLAQPEESVTLLTAEMDAGSDTLTTRCGQLLRWPTPTSGESGRRASLAIGALARHLPRYQRSMTNYARLLLDGDPGDA